RLMTILGSHEVSIAQVVQDGAPIDPSNRVVWVVVLTHTAREGNVRAALADIDRLAVVREPVRVIRIEG
ncbi:MAG: homoserine dehydrogenase, partial [Kofleriaceae bacterium]